MATVYLAHDVRHNRDVALKVLKAELAAVVGAERFLAEIETTAKLTHPHILPLHDSGEADGFLFFVTPFVEGEALRDRIDREKQLGVEDALEITEDVASALDYAHTPDTCSDEGSGVYPPNVDAAIRKALEKLPADRFTSAQGFSKALSDSGFRHREVLRVAGMLGRPGGLGRLVSRSKVFRG